MKKFMYLLLAGLFSVAMISCSEDDKNDGGKDDGGETPMVYMQPKTIQFVSEAFPGFKLTYTIADKKITKLTHFTSKGGSDVTTDFAVTYETSKVKASYNDPNQGEVMNIVYTLNEKGFPTTAIKSYSSDGTEAQSYTFEYDAKGMLTSIKDKRNDNEVAFSATYTDTQMNTYMSMGAEYTYTNSTTINNCSIDPTFLFTFLDDELGGTLSTAVYLGLMPQSKFLPSALGADGAEVKVKATMAGTSLSEYEMDVDEEVMATFKYTY